MTITPDGNLLAAFSHHGVFELSGANWVKRFDLPWDSRIMQAKEILENEGQIAIVTRPEVKTGDNSESDHLWIWRDGRISEFSLQ